MSLHVSDQSVHHQEDHDHDPPDDGSIGLKHVETNKQGL